MFAGTVLCMQRMIDDGGARDCLISSPNPNLVDKRATLTPEHRANLWLTKAFEDGFLAGAGFNYVADRKADPANTFTLPS